MKPTWQRAQSALVCYAALAAGAVIMLFPFYYMVITSLKSDEEAASVTMQVFVENPTTEPFAELLGATSFARAALNSLIVSGAVTIGNMLLCPLAGYAFAKHRFPGRQAIFIVLLSTMMLPPSVLIVPGFLLARDLGWLNTWLPLIVPNLAMPFGVFLARQFIEKIPDDLIAAAKIDGCGEIGIYRNVIMPLSGPLLGTLGIFTFLTTWNNFIWPLVILRDEELLTIPLVIALLQGRFFGNENVQMAGAVLSILPVLLVFAIFQKRIVQSLASTGLKE